MEKEVKISTIKGKEISFKTCDGGKYWYISNIKFPICSDLRNTFYNSLEKAVNAWNGYAINNQIKVHFLSPKPSIEFVEQQREQMQEWLNVIMED